MAEYIKREDVKTAIRERFNSLADRVEINTIVNMMPHIDIVRCKECKWYKQSETFCENGNGLWQAGNECYCSYGEREGE